MKGKTLIIMSITLCLILSGCFGQRPPKGNLIYCSYSKTRVAGQGKDYCEIINENGNCTVNVVMNENSEFSKPFKGRYEASEADINRLHDIIMKEKIYELDGYRRNSHMTGGATFRIYMEFDSGEWIETKWYTDKPSKKAVEAYDTIYSFFSTWR